MELRGQDKDLGMPMGYNTLPQPNQATDRRRNEILGHHHLHQQLNLQQQHHTLAAARDSNPDPAPAQPPPPPPSATIGSASNSKTPVPPQPPPPALATTRAASILYGECLKNHAASMGGHVTDGCGEFMPSGEEGTPEALKCAACDCHRNFHRREIKGEAPSGANSHYPYNPHNRSSSHRTTIQLAAQAPPPPPPPPPLPPAQWHHRYSHGFSHGLSISPSAGPIPPAMMAFGAGSSVPAESSSEDLNMFQSNVGTQPAAQPPYFSETKKRFRTKFTQEQKDRMQEFAERLEWKIQKQDDHEVEKFCTEVGVKKQVFKVQRKHILERKFEMHHQH
ncbi:hypothetical protein U1Q18_011687 [Sarracenia purpurea var. burkii]